MERGELFKISKEELIKMIEKQEKEIDNLNNRLIEAWDDNFNLQEYIDGFE